VCRGRGRGGGCRGGMRFYDFLLDGDGDDWDGMG
jgi:hypothetical protein